MEPCRRRAIWAAQAEVTNQPEIQHEQQNEVLQNADDYAERDAHEANASKTNEANADAQGHEGKINKFKYACIKCGKEVRRGMYMHQKYCKG